MASSLSISFLFFLLCIIFSTSASAPSFRPKALVLPVTKLLPSRQYITHISQRTPLVPIALTVDLGSRFLWVDCEQGYVSSSYKPARCRSAQCSLAKSSSCGECFGAPKPGCNNNTCGHFPGNTIIHLSTSGEIASDQVSVQSTDGFNPTGPVRAANFLFVCGSSFLLEGLAGRVKGMAGFGRTAISLPSQFAAAFSFPRKFAVCLTASTRFPGVIFIGNGPYVLLPNNDVSKSLTYTPLFINPVSTAGVSSQGEKSSEYFIGVKSIVINGKTVPLNSSLLSISSAGVGGTKISTVDPYTVMESSIYNAVVGTFIGQLAKVPRVPSVAPFGACFDARSIGSTRLGAGVPSIDLVLQNKKVVWRIFGANSMVEVREGVLCLGVVDGGFDPTTAIVIGAHQLEDNLLEFDLARSRLGFSSTLLGQRTTCANFNFTSKA